MSLRSFFKKPSENNVLKILFYLSKLECRIHEGKEISSVWIIPDSPCHYHACLENDLDLVASSFIRLCRNPPLVWGSVMALQKDRLKTREKFCVYITGEGLRWSDTSSGSACSLYVTAPKPLHLFVPKILICRSAAISPHTCLGPMISDRDYAQWRTLRPAITWQNPRIKTPKHFLIPRCNSFSSHHSKTVLTVTVIGEKFPRGVQALQSKREGPPSSFAGSEAKPLCSSQNSNVQTSVLLFQTNLHF